MSLPVLVLFASPKLSARDKLANIIVNRVVYGSTVTTHKIRHQLLLTYFIIISLMI